MRDLGVGIVGHLRKMLAAIGELSASTATPAEPAAAPGAEDAAERWERHWLAEMHRIEGQIALKRSESQRTRAEACFLKAIEIARQQEARMLELHASIDLARLWHNTGSGGDPRALLETVLAKIEGGETLRDVRDARALLAALA